jgi:superfamily II DNA or RNA helicase
MLIVLGSRALIAGLPETVLNATQKLLTIDNPLFFKRIDMGLSNWSTPSNLIYYKFEDNVMDVPIGALHTILEMCNKEGINNADIEIRDNRVSNLQTKFFKNIKFTGELRDYQREIVNSCKGKTVGIVEAMTGSGKTITFVALTVERKESTLILVHTIELANQTVQAFANFTNLNKEDIGFIGNGRWEVKPITVALHQTMAKLKPKKFSMINKKFGQIIADEVHIVGAETYYQTMTHLSAKYKFGFSATPKRDDGLTEVIHFATGPKIHTVDTSLLEDVLIKPTIVRINTNYNFPIFTSDEYQALITDLSVDKDRNQLIVDTVNKPEYRDRNMCFLCVRISQVEALKKYFVNDAEILTSKMNKKKRKLVMEKLLNGDCKKIISTYALFSTGIDIPQLDLALLCAPLQAEVRIKQTAGRLMRKAPGKTEATIIDFVDIKVSLLKYQFYKRNRIYKKLW